MSSSRSSWLRRSTRYAVFTLAITSAGLLAGSVAAAPAPAVPAAAPAPEEAVALREALWQLERSLRRRLATAELGGRAPGASGAAAEEAEWLRRRLGRLRLEARRLAGGSGGELEAKARALRPLLLDLERAAGGARRVSPSPWRPGAGRAAVAVNAAAGGSCAAALPVGDGAWRAALEPAGELWLRYTAPVSGWARVTTAGSDLDTVVEVYAACPAGGGAPVVRGDDEIGLQAAAVFRVAAGESRWIRVAGWRGAAGSLAVGLGGGTTGISGAVTEEASGDPLEFEQVQLWDQNGFFESSTSTDVFGGYLFSGFPPGNYFVNTDLFISVLLDELYDDHPCPGGVFSGGCDPLDGTPIPVSPDTVVSGIDLALGPGAIVTGRVRDAVTGEALAFARISMFAANGAFLGTEFADAAGRYRVSGLGPGVGFARAQHDLYGSQLYDGIPCPGPCDPTTGTPIPLTIGVVAGGIDFHLEPLGGIAGRLTTVGGGEPVPFESLEIYDADGFLVQLGGTDSQGNYQVGGLEPGEHFVATRTSEYVDELYDGLPCEPSCDPTAGMPVPVTSGATTTGIDFELRRLGRITGRVTDAATLQGIGASILLFDAAGDFFSVGSTQFGGHYELPGLPDGTYFVTASDFEYLGELYDDLPCPGGFPPACDLTTGTPVPAQVDVVTSDIDFALERLGSIRGTVTDAATGEPVRFQSVAAYDANGFSHTFASTDSLGRYELFPLEPGDYFVVARSDQHFAELYDDLPCPDGPPAGCDPTTGTAVPIAVGSEVSGIDFALAPKGAIEGRVTDAGNGLPVSFGSVEVWSSAGELAASASIGDFGEYRVGGLDAGTYFVTCTPFDYAGELYDDLPCALGCDPTTGTPVAVTTGATTPGIDFELEHPGKLSGRITESETGAPAFNLVVLLFDAEGQFFDSQFVSSSDGSYEFQRVPEGTWYVIADGLPDHETELYDDLPCPSGPPSGCDPTAGTPVAVANGAETAGIDFALDVASGIVGRVTDDLGVPLPGVAIDLWSTDGDLVGSVASSLTGFYRLAPSAGTYFVSTDNGQGFTDELFDDVACPLGPAFEGLCDPLDGDPVVLVTFDSLVDGVDFQLSDSPVIFTDGFESGDVSAWSNAVP